MTKKVFIVLYKVCTLDYFKYKIFLLRHNVYMNSSKQLKLLRDFIDEKLRLQAKTVEGRNIDGKTWKDKVCEGTEL